MPGTEQTSHDAARSLNYHQSTLFPTQVVFRERKPNARPWVPIMHHRAFLALELSVWKTIYNIPLSLKTGRDQYVCLPVRARELLKRRPQEKAAAGVGRS